MCSVTVVNLEKRINNPEAILRFMEEKLIQLQEQLKSTRSNNNILAKTTQEVLLYCHNQLAKLYQMSFEKTETQELYKELWHILMDPKVFYTKVKEISHDFFDCGCQAAYFAHGDNLNLNVKVFEIWTNSIFFHEIVGSSAYWKGFEEGLINSLNGELKVSYRGNGIWNFC